MSEGADDHPRRIIFGGQEIRAKPALDLGELIRSQVHPDDYRLLQMGACLKPDGVVLAVEYILWGRR